MKVFKKIQNTFLKYLKYKYKIHEMYLKYVFKIHVFQILLNTAHSQLSRPLSHPIIHHHFGRFDNTCGLATFVYKSLIAPFYHNVT